MSIHRKKINIANVVIISALLVGIVLAVVYNSRTISALTYNQMQESVISIVNQQARTLSAQVEGKYNELHALGSTFTIEELENPDTVINKINAYAQASDFYTVNFAYPDGTAYRNDGLQMDLSDRWYFKQCLQGMDTIERLESGKLVDDVRFGVAVPVISGGKVQGVLVGDYDEKIFRNIFAGMNSIDGGYSYISTIEGEVIIEDHVDVEQDEQEIYKQISSDLAEEKSGYDSYTCNEEEYYLIYQKTEINDWYIVSLIPQTRVDEIVSMASVSSAGMIGCIILMAMGIVAVLLIQERKRERQAKVKAAELKDQLEHDELTGLIVEKVFLNEVRERLTHADSGEYAIVYFDVDHFKLINELFGRETGDEVLGRLAEAGKKLAGEFGGRICRIAGDEFAFLALNSDILLTRLRESAERQKQQRLFPMDIAVHFGLYVIYDTTEEINSMIDCAKMAQKRIKGNYGKYVTHYSAALKQKVFRIQEIESNMEHALENGEFVVYLQPQNNYKDHVVTGAEALVRWIRPGQGVISPDNFIPVFESNGFITRLDEFVWEESCRILRRWIDEGKKPIPISVNVSRADLFSGSVAVRLEYLIKKYGISEELLRVEITESAYMDNPTQLLNAINQLKEKGFIVEMDDFGSGYSSLNMLKDVPIDVLKTDLKFLDTAGIEGRRDQILGTVITLAHQIGLQVIAEGVETQEQADYLLTLNCKTMQGYYFSRPVPVDEFEKITFLE